MAAILSWSSCVSNEHKISVTHRHAIPCVILNIQLSLYIVSTWFFHVKFSNKCYSTLLLPVFFFIKPVFGQMFVYHFYLQGYWYCLQFIFGFSLICNGEYSHYIFISRLTVSPLCCLLRPDWKAVTCICLEIRNVNGLLEKTSINAFHNIGTGKHIKISYNKWLLYFLEFWTCHNEQHYLKIIHIFINTQQIFMFNVSI